MKKPLLIGIGNTLRSDDGAGPALVAEFTDDPRCLTRIVHQLLPEHADELAEAERVLFVDAAVDCPLPVRLPIDADGATSRLGHHCSPEWLLSLCRLLHSRAPEAEVLRLPATDFTLGEQFSSTTVQAVAQGRNLIDAWLSTPSTVIVQRWRVRISGRVQGVGFRPFIYQGAEQFQLVGFVSNDASGVILEVQGPLAALSAFLDHARQGPIGSRVEHLEKTVIPTEADASFQIRSSTATGDGITDPAVDLAPCPDCWREFHDPTDRRFHYPFLNCIRCGPRFTILHQLPYDRPRTSLATFPLCLLCRREYENPADRRFHAQAMACPVCGPQVSWTMPGGDRHDSSAAIQQAQEALHQGNIIAVKGIGGFHIAASIRHPEAIQRLRQIKGRGDKPLALLARSIEMVRQYAEVDEAAEQLLSSPERPIVLLPIRPEARGVAAIIAPGLSRLGFLLPYTPLHQLLLEDDPIVLTSANRSGEPLMVEESEVRTAFGDQLSGILSHNRPIAARCDDSVSLPMRNRLPELPIRRSRGYAPDPLPLVESGPTVLAVGGEQKVAFSVAIGRKVYVGPHVGDVHSSAAWQHLAESARHFCQLLNVRPERIACDAHPGYLTRRWAESYATELGIPLVACWHHESHVASWQVDTQTWQESALVICCDGTGYGPDQTIWGGEFFRVDGATRQRVAHLQPVPLLGGESAIEQPIKMALAYLWNAGLDEAQVPAVQAALSVSQIKLLRQQFDRRLNCPLTSSLGRLFDAVAALIGLRGRSTYEGQAAAELEAMAEPDNRAAYQFGLLESEPIRIDARPILRDVLRDVRADVSPSRIAWRVHQAVAVMMANLVRRVRAVHQLSIVGLTGGVFQNALLVELLRQQAVTGGWELRCHSRVPCNDGGLSVGQVVLARGADARVIA